MTHPALAAAVTAARDFADAMEAAHAALNISADPTEVKVGDFAATEAAALTLLERLPVGAEVEDRDGDYWIKAADGRVAFLDEGEGAAQDPENAARYVPLTVSALPEPEHSFKRGDTVRITGRSRYWADNIGRTGTVGDPEYAGGDVEVFVNGTQFVYPPDRIVAEPATAPLVVDFRTTEDSSRSVSAARSLYQTGAYLRLNTVTQSASVHLTKEETRQLAATLTAIADGAE